jgi:hypothetical protein
VEARTCRIAALALVACTACAHDAGARNGERPAPARPEREEVSPFTASVRDYRGVVQLVGAMPMLDESDGLRRALRTLATAIRRVPAASRPMVEEAATLIGDREFQIWVDARRNQRGGSGPAREALEVAAAALRLVADGPYANRPSIADAVEKMQASTDEIVPTEELDDNRQALVHALEHALAALEAMDDPSHAGASRVDQVVGLP